MGRGVQMYLRTMERRQGSVGTGDNVVLYAVISTLAVT